MCLQLDRACEGCVPPASCASSSGLQRLFFDGLPVFYLVLPSSWAQHRYYTSSIKAWYTGVQHRCHLISPWKYRTCPSQTYGTSVCILTRLMNHICTKVSGAWMDRTHHFLLSDGWHSLLSYFNKLHQIPAH